MAQTSITYYHPLKQWLSGANNVNQGQALMHLQYSENINQL